MELVLISVIGLGLLAAALATTLGVADRYLSVESDPRVEEIVEALPGTNCGGCGHPGCRAYAEAVAKSDDTPDKCKPGGADVAADLGEIMGVEIGQIVKEVAMIHCHAGADIRKVRAEYHGPRSCKTADLVGGHTECQWGCLGLDDCERACTFGAMEMVNGLPVVDAELCTACGQCVRACPRDIISLQPMDPAHGIVYVACKSEDKGPLSKKNCDVGCIGCGICNRRSPNELFTIGNFLASGVSEKIMQHEAEAEYLMEQCPRSCILRRYQTVEIEAEVADEA